MFLFTCFLGMARESCHMVGTVRVVLLQACDINVHKRT